MADQLALPVSNKRTNLNVCITLLNAPVVVSVGKSQANATNKSNATVAELSVRKG